ncbi:MAG TPA: hypothetical protein VFE62_20655 [Gemmataceae bacterium]|nr:hypothetical protein [Gemmataceae bacterium]
MRIALCLIALAGLVTVSHAQPDKKADAKPAVRALKFSAKDPSLVFKIGAKGKVTVLEDAAAVEKLVGKESAKQLVDAVDFTKDKIAFVSWSTGGPPDGKLTYRGKENMITFYVQAPQAKARGERLRIGADFFAVPRNFKVAFDPKEQ